VRSSRTITGSVISAEMSALDFRCDRNCLSIIDAAAPNFKTAELKGSLLLWAAIMSKMTLSECG
jgi:hypothetical protein